MDHQNQMPVHPLQINPGPPQIQTQQHNMHFPQPLYVTQPPAVPSRQTPPRGFQENTITAILFFDVLHKLEMERELN